MVHHEKEPCPRNCDYRERPGRGDVQLNLMIENIGIGWSLRILGILAFVVNFVCAILLKDRIKAVGAIHSAFDYFLFGRVEFLLFLGWGFFSMLG